MTTHDGEGRCWKRDSFAAGSPHFFKIIVADTLLSGKLGVPKRFSRRYASDLPLLKSVRLQVPGGSTWPVELEKADGRVWFCKGWREFVDHYSLDYGHLVLFRYEGDSTFHVIIFDESACEIDYPLREEGEFLSPKREEEEEADDVVELPTFHGFKPISPRSHPQSRSIRPADMMRRSYPSSSSMKELKGRLKESKCGASVPAPVRLDHSLPVQLSPLPLEAAGQFKSKHPFFKLVISPSYLRRSCANIPLVFLKRYIPKSLETATLRHGDRSQCVTLKWYSGGKRGVFGCGWLAFTREAHLMKGDVCLFELIDPKDCVFQCHHFAETC